MRRDDRGQRRRTRAKPTIPQAAARGGLDQARLPADERQPDRLPDRRGRRWRPGKAAGRNPHTAGLSP